MTERVYASVRRQQSEFPQLRRYALLLVIALGVIVVDQAAKSLVSSSLADGRVINLLGGLIRLDYTRNSGAAFSIFRGDGSVFGLVAILVSVGILVYYRRAATGPLLLRMGLALVLGGALGNLIDRVRLGYVVDFIDLQWWPVFNLADSAIVVGVILLIIQATYGQKRPDERG
jgi:signal peptidase II